MEYLKFKETIKNNSKAHYKTINAKDAFDNTRYRFLASYGDKIISVLPKKVEKDGEKTIIHSFNVMLFDKDLNELFKEQLKANNIRSINCHVYKNDFWIVLEIHGDNPLICHHYKIQEKELVFVCEYELDFIKGVPKISFSENHMSILCYSYIYLFDLSNGFKVKQEIKYQSPDHDKIILFNPVCSSLSNDTLVLLSWSLDDYDKSWIHISFYKVNSDSGLFEFSNDKIIFNKYANNIQLEDNKMLLIGQSLIAYDISNTEKIKYLGAAKLWSNHKTHKVIKMNDDFIGFSDGKFIKHASMVEGKIKAGDKLSSSLQVNDLIINSENVYIYDFKKGLCLF